MLGESGAGKSHLIRWVNAKIPAKAGRHVIYLQKTQTSLKDVIEALLVDQHDPGLDEIRRRVSSLGAGVTADEMEHKILAELAEALRTAKADNPYGKALVGENGLRLFFTDPLFEHHLLRPGSFIKRRAKHALHGRDADEPDVPLEFTADELPLDIVDNDNIGDAAAATQKLFSRLVASSAMQTEAVRLLNEYLDVAVTKAASLNVGDIGQAFKKIRERLVGQEIVLLIEDVALIQGVRRDLLDAIIEVGVVQGNGEVRLSPYPDGCHSQLLQRTTTRDLPSARRGVFGDLSGRRRPQSRPREMPTRRSCWSTSSVAISTPPESVRTPLSRRLQVCPTGVTVVSTEGHATRRSGSLGRAMLSTGSTHTTARRSFAPSARAQLGMVTESTSTHARCCRVLSGTPSIATSG